MRKRCIIAGLTCLLAVGGAWADDHDHPHGTPPPAKSPAAQRLREALLEELGRGNLDRAVEMALKAASGTLNPAVHAECLHLLSSIARQSLRSKDYVIADKAVAAMLRLAPGDPAAVAMSKSIATARTAVPERLKDVRRWLAVEWYEPAFQTLSEAIALAPDRRSELTEDYFSAAVGVGDDHYFTKNFREAFYAYDAAIQIQLGDRKPVKASLATRWLQSMVFALVDDVDRASFSPQFWQAVMQRVAAAPKASTGDAALRAMVRGLAAEDSGDAATAAREYASVAGGEGAISGGGLSVSDARRAAVTQLRRLYDPALSPRRAGNWRKQTGEGWRILEAPGFRIHHRNEKVARAVADALAFHLERVAELLGQPPGKIPWSLPCEVWIYQDKKQYEQAVHPVNDAVLASTDIRLRGNTLEAHALHVTQSDPMLLSSTLAHELTHLVVGAVTKYRSLPGALAEGMALAAEPRGRQIQFARIHRGLRQRRTAAALLQLNDTHPPDAAFYAESAHLITRLRTHRGLIPLLSLPDRPTPQQIAKAYDLADAAALDKLFAANAPDAAPPTPR